MTYDPPQEQPESDPGPGDDYQVIQRELLDCLEEKCEYASLYRYVQTILASALVEKKTAEETRDRAQATATMDVFLRRKEEARVQQLEEFITKAGLTVPDWDMPKDDNGF